MDAAERGTEPPAALQPPAAPPEPATRAPPWSMPSLGTRRWIGVGVRLFILALVAGLVAFLAHQWDWFVASAPTETTDDAYLQADTTPLAARVPGYLRAIPVQDFQRVRQGDLLAEIVDDDYRAQLAQANASVAAAEAAITVIEQQRIAQDSLIAQAEANITASRADLVRYHLETERQEALLATGITGTRQITEQAIDNEQRAAAALALNRAQAAQQRQQVNVLDAQLQQAHAALLGQQAARDLAQINLGYTRITAPVDGMVGRRLVQAGQYLSVGTQVISVVPLPNVWVIANYKETQMTHVRAGQPVRVTVDAFPGAVLHGHVESWSPASGAEFALLPPDNATGNFTKVVQRIPVKILLDPDPKVQDLLRPGMSVIARIDTR